MKQGNQDVKAALDLLGEMLEGEQARMKKAGQDAFGRNDMKTARSISAFGSKLDKFSNQVSTLAGRWAKIQKMRDHATPAVRRIMGRLLFGGGVNPGRAREVRNGFTRTLTHPLAPKSNFTVTFPDGSVVGDKKAAVVFAKSIEKIGAERIEKLDVRLGGEPLVAKMPSPKYRTQCEKISDGYFVKTHCGTAAKMRILARIAKIFGIPLKLDFVKPAAFAEQPQAGG